MSGQNNKKQPIRTDFEGNTVAEAIETALKELNIPKDNLKIQILTEGKKGLFGMQGEKRAKIRVTILSNGSNK